MAEARAISLAEGPLVSEGPAVVRAAGADVPIEVDGQVEYAFRVLVSCSPGAGYSASATEAPRYYIDVEFPLPVSAPIGIRTKRLRFLGQAYQVEGLIEIEMWPERCRVKWRVREP